MNNRYQGGAPCQAHQQNQCASNSHSRGDHVCTMVVVIMAMCAAQTTQCASTGEKRPSRKQEDTERDERQWSPAVSMDDSSQPTGGKEQTAGTEHQ